MKLFDTGSLQRQDLLKHRVGIMPDCQAGSWGVGGTSTTSVTMQDEHKGDIRTRAEAKAGTSFHRPLSRLGNAVSVEPPKAS